MTDRKTKAARGLGKGLGALLATNKSSAADNAAMNSAAMNSAAMNSVTMNSPAEHATASQQVLSLSLDKIAANRDQPRKEFDLTKLRELADSIATKGIIQPIVVRYNAKLSPAYQIVVGERRWRAAKLAGLETIPAIVRNFASDEVLELALIENIQRSELNPLEEAQAYQELLQKFNYQQQDLAKRLGKSRPYIANSLRLLNLPSQVKQMLQNGEISPAHGRSLLAFSNGTWQLELARQAASTGLTVRELEELARRQTDVAEKAKSELKTKQAKQKLTVSAENAAKLEQQRVCDDLEQALQAKVKLKVLADGSGNLTISFASTEQFNALYDSIIN